MSILGEQARVLQVVKLSAKQRVSFILKVCAPGDRLKIMFQLLFNIGEV